MKYHCQDHQLTLADEDAIYKHGCPLSVVRLGPILPPFNKCSESIQDVAGQQGATIPDGDSSGVDGWGSGSCV